MTKAAHLGLRLAAAIGGGYVLSAQIAALGAASLVSLGLARSEATTVALLSAYLIYLGVLLWAFWEPRLGRLWCIVAGGALCTWAALEALR